MSVDLATLAIRVESLETVIAGKRLDTLGNKAAVASQKTNLMSQAATKLAVAFGGLLAARQLIGIYSEITQVTAKFEASIAELSAITGATGDDLIYLSERSKEFGRTTTLSASQAAEAFKLVASAKPDLLESGEALAAVTKNAITLAEATGSTLPDAADTLGQSLNQFGAGADQAERFINVLAAGAQKGASFVNETAEALKYAGTVAASAGISFESTNAAIQNLSTVGIKGSEAGAALRNIFLKLEGQTEARFKPSVVGLTQALSNLDEGMKTGAVDTLKLFGLRSVVAGNQLIKNSEQVGKLEVALEGTNTAYEQAATKVDTYEGAIKQLNSAQEALQIRIGEGLEPTQRKLVETMTRATNAYTLFLGESDKVDDGSGILESTLLTLIRAAFLVKTAFNELGDTIGFVAAHFVNGAGIIGDVIGGMGKYIGSVFNEIGINVQIAVAEFVDIGNAVGAFAARIQALLSFDFDLAKTIGEARAEVAAGADAEIEALRKRAEAVRDGRSEIVSATIDEVKARAEASDALDADFIAQRKATAEQVALFIARTDASYKSNEATKESINLTEEEIAKLEEKKRVQAELQQIALQLDSQSALEGVARDYETEIEAAERNAAEQKSILAGIVTYSEEQERLKAETSKRIDAELYAFKEEQNQKKLDAIKTQADEELRAEERHAATLAEFRALGAETEVEAEQIRFEARIERLRARGESEQIEERVITEAIEMLRAGHVEKLIEIERKAEQKRRKAKEHEQKYSLKNQAAFLSAMTAGVAQHNRAMFEVNKAAALAEAAMNIPSAASKAYEFGSKGGPVLGAAFAAMAVAAELAHMQAIASTSFAGGGGGTTPSLAGGGGVVNDIPVGNNDDLLNPPDTRGDEEPRVNIIVSGNIGFTPDVIDQIAEGLREATGERDVVIFEENSRQAQDVVSQVNVTG